MGRSLERKRRLIVLTTLSGNHCEKLGDFCPFLNPLCLPCSGPRSWGQAIRSSLTVQVAASSAPAERRDGDRKKKAPTLWTGASPDVCSTIPIMMNDPRAPPGAAHPSSRSAPPTVAPATAASSGENGNGQEQHQLPLRPSHELPFVAPSSYLRPKPPSRTMSERTPNALDKEQMQGLVSMALESDRDKPAVSRTRRRDAGL